MKLNPLSRRILFRPLLLLIATAALLSGCKSPDVATGFSKGNIKKVTVDRIVPAFGLRVGIRTTGGIAGISDAIVNKIYQGDLEEIQATMDSVNLDVPKMVRQEFIKRLDERGLVQIVDQNPDAVFLIQIRQFGFTEYPPLTGNDVPFLELVCRLVDGNENTVWKAVCLQARRGYPGMGGSLKDYRDASKLQTDWETQIRLAVDKILSPR